MVQNYFKVSNMCAKIVVSSYLVCENFVKFFTNIEIDSTFLSSYDNFFFKIFTNCKISLIFKNEFYKSLNKTLPMQFFKQIFQ